MDTSGAAWHPLTRGRIFGDLIPYQNDGKNCSAIVGKVERA
jgi:hypothetical protein